MPTNPTTEIAAETIARISPSKARFSTGGGAATVEYIIPAANIGMFIQNILGNVSKSANGSLKRILPAAHPYYDWLYASEISNIEGISPSGVADASNYQRIIQSHFKDVATYRFYKLTVNFQPRPYLIIDDATLSGYAETKLQYTDLGSPPASVSFVDRKEYARFVEISVDPNAEYLTTAVNTFVFSTPLSGSGSPDGKPVANQNGGGINLLVSKPTVKLTWYFVPYEIVFSSNIQEAQGKVNQNTFFNFPPGSLLFTGVETNKYSPPYQNIAQSPLTARPEQTRLCDITFVFKLFAPKTSELGLLPIADPGMVVVNGQTTGFAIPYGHNLCPWPSDLKYYYAKIGNDKLLPGRPIYTAYPMEKLFLLN